MSQQSLRTRFDPSNALFLVFAVLVAGRDVLFDLWLTDHPIHFAFVLTATVGVAASTLVWRSGSRAFLDKLTRPGVPLLVLGLGLAGAVVNGVTFWVIGRMGAGLFNLVDFGVLPVVTALFARFAFREALPRGLGVSFVLYAIGLFLILHNREMHGLVYLAIALLSPLGTAFSDALMKKLLSSGFAFHEALTVRFLPAAGFLWLFLAGTGETVTIESPWKTFTVAVLFGFIPMVLLCLGLMRNALGKLAVWQFAIPAFAFIGTLPWRYDVNGKPLPLLGAGMILSTHLVLHLCARREARSHRSIPA